MTAVIKLEGVSKKFILRHEKVRSFQQTVVDLLTRRNGTREEFWALKDVTFEVNKGDAVGVIGRNGSGKSTILKLMTRILTPTSGSVYMNGKVSALIELGAGFHPDLTGRENIYLNGSILGIGRKEMDRKFDEILSFAELERFIDTPVKHYSSGMYMRLGFSVAMSVDPDILIVDEILSVGDEAFQRKCLERVRSLQQRGMTLILVSHSLPVIEQICSRVIWLDEGRVRRMGSVAEVLAEYREALTPGEPGVVMETTAPEATAESMAADSGTGSDDVIEGWLDSPPTEEVFAEESLEVTGWAFSRAGKVSQVEVIDLDNNAVLARLDLCVPRPDVIAQRPWQTETVCGFHDIVDLRCLAEGSTRLLIRASDEQGNRREWQRRVMRGAANQVTEGTDSPPSEMMTVGADD